MQNQKPEKRILEPGVREIIRVEVEVEAERPENLMDFRKKMESANHQDIPLGIPRGVPRGMNQDVLLVDPQTMLYGGHQSILHSCL